MNYLFLSTILSSNKRISFKHLQSSGQLGRARSTMIKSNESFMGEQFGARQNGSSDSGSSYDSTSSDDHNRNQSRKRVTKSRIGVETPMGQRELEPDAFRGAMNSDDSSLNANRGNFSTQHLESKMWMRKELLQAIATFLMRLILAMSRKI